MRERKALLGYNAKKVRRYVSLLETEMLLLNQQQQEGKESFQLAQAELLSEIEDLRKNLAELDQLETSLKRWITQNESR
ncbi:hypothetical protein N0M98_22905 [Paenibacillus doosanensis]|uniref:Uncharacterized protein n=1 Tax=Paenibacillus konkukensis TaxID=2020716 RepID=A0ABY4RN82_9BACL|nr:MULTISPECIES: hypothetical protein [Paenibacillus]MCS7462980.1 hypothetical protein [Paenibacillus doosanensis]UQZ83886.1 hypothetical protein SK3146_03093 [Paenibacillus konkukensis]